ncbi:hypothetical protein DFH09DRAFT_1116099 [Mycena vulgaris]|nr:hypothetical protein DFH09DRAFT_1116099 [Mycena vulgaris]
MAKSRKHKQPATQPQPVKNPATPKKSKKASCSECPGAPDLLSSPRSKPNPHQLVSQLRQYIEYAAGMPHPFPPPQFHMGYPYQPTPGYQPHPTLRANPVTVKFQPLCGTDFLTFSLSGSAEADQLTGISSTPPPAQPQQLPYGACTPVSPSPPRTRPPPLKISKTSTPQRTGDADTHVIWEHLHQNSSHDTPEFLNMQPGISPTLTAASNSSTCVLVIDPTLTQSSTTAVATMATTATVTMTTTIPPTPEHAGVDILAGDLDDGRQEEEEELEGDKASDSTNDTDEESERTPANTP